MHNAISKIRLVIVANRLPISIRSLKPLDFQKSPGGLVSGIETFIRKAGISSWIWIGWAGSNLKKKDLNNIKDVLPQEHNCLPVYVPEKLMDRFYNGFCNRTLWPLFHSMPTLATYEKTFWESYLEVNRIFLKAILEHIEVDDETYLWIHDYHLMPIPSMLRESLPIAKIGFFLHIPFPPPEIFAQLPWRREVLEGLLGADLIGFHTHEYTINFLRSLTRILGIDYSMGGFVYADRHIKADTFPMGIDFELFNSLESSDKKAEVIKETLGHKKIVFSVDRLDYTKGIYNRLLAFEDFLLRRQDWHSRVVLILNLVPSREHVEHYQRMKNQIEQKVAQINGKFGSVEWVPVLYHYTSLPTEDLVAHYRASDVLLVTSIKDGMNLIAKEFVASRKDLRGVLILSEFAGSSKELGETMVVNPNSVEELSRAIELALEMSPEEQENRLKAMQERLKRYHVLKWGKDFLESLKDIASKRDTLKTKELNRKLLKRLRGMFKNARKKLLLVDYDGTLVPLARTPYLAMPTQEIKNILQKLGEVENTRVVLVSGRKKEQLDKWFGTLPITLVAEHGCLLKEPGEEWTTRCVANSEILEKVRAMMELCVDRLPQSFIEEKNFTLVFHYRNSDPEMASMRVKELIDELSSLIANTDYSILLGNKVVEIRPAGINKGTIALYFCQDCDFVFSMGDDITDEDMFKALPSKAITIKVGAAPSFAKYYVPSQNEALNVLRFLLEDEGG